MQWVLFFYLVTTGWIFDMIFFMCEFHQSVIDCKDKTLLMGYILDSPVAVASGQQ